MTQPNYKLFPFTVINNYVGDYLAAKNIMAKTITIKGQQQPSIVPAAQTPELVDASSPGTDRAPAFMVYSLELDQTDNEVYMKHERMSYVIYAPTVSKVMEILYALEDLFGNLDISAQLLNASAARKGSIYNFFSTDYEVQGGPVATTNEGGRYGAVIRINYSFNSPVDPNTAMRI